MYNRKEKLKRTKRRDERNKTEVTKEKDGVGGRRYNGRGGKVGERSSKRIEKCRRMWINSEAKTSIPLKQ